MKRLFMLFMSMIPLVLFAQEESLNVGGMEFSYTLRDDSVDIKLSAPTRGWVGVGFNSQNNIVHSDLLLFHIIGNRAESSDMYVVGFGNPQKDETLGGSSSVKLIDFQETNDQTFIHFSIAMNSLDSYDFKHKTGKDFWLILAYSTHDDFGHHSRMRKHVKYRFEN